MKLSVSGRLKEFQGTGHCLQGLASSDLFAVYHGELSFRGFKPKHIPVASDELRDEDFRPGFEQKKVDMRIGLDIAHFALTRQIDRIILICGDTDCIPAMKLCRISGLKVVLVTFPDRQAHRSLAQHADYVRSLEWPS